LAYGQRIAVHLAEQAAPAHGRLIDCVRPLVLALNRGDQGVPRNGGTGRRSVTARVWPGTGDRERYNSGDSKDDETTLHTQPVRTGSSTQYQ
jgi:hypothetical protein